MVRVSLVNFSFGNPQVAQLSAGEDKWVQSFSGEESSAALFQY